MKGLKIDAIRKLAFYVVVLGACHLKLSQEFSSSSYFSTISLFIM